MQEFASVDLENGPEPESPDGRLSMAVEAPTAVMAAARTTRNTAKRLRSGKVRRKSSKYLRLGLDEYAEVTTDWPIASEDRKMARGVSLCAGDIITITKRNHPIANITQSEVS
eukprot:SAG31_NODE_2900_length_4934_cov_2.001448_7_plen_113_part_00